MENQIKVGDEVDALFPDGTEEDGVVAEIDGFHALIENAFGEKKWTVAIVCRPINNN